MTFPNNTGKYNSKPVFNPDDAIRYRDNTGRGVKHDPFDGIIICYAREIVEHIESSYKFTVKDGYYSSKLYILKTGEKTIGVITNFGFGAPIAIAFLERFIVSGVKQFINIGIAGTLQRHVNIGDIVVCDKAIRDEGTSYHYTPPSKYSLASPNMTNDIEASLKSQGISYHVGSTWTIDAPYRETEDEVKQYQAEGVLTVDMEASALFTVAEFRGVEMGSLFTISDSLADLDWKPEFHAEETRKGLKLLFDTALRTLVFS